MQDLGTLPDCRIKFFFVRAERTSSKLTVRENIEKGAVAYPLIALVSVELHSLGLEVSVSLLVLLVSVELHSLGLGS